MNKNEIKTCIEDFINKHMLVEARSLLEEYKKLFGNDEGIVSMEAIVDLYEGNYEEALKCIRVGLNFNIFNSDLYYTMGNVYELKGEYDRAYICYEQAEYLCSTEENKKVIKNNINSLVKDNDIKVRKTSIIILTYNNLEYTKICINSIKNYNKKDAYEIIIIDNNSNDGTREWLKEQKDFRIILNDENRGFPAGCNQGIEVSEKGNDILLLNNDTVIMPNSIFNMRMALYSKGDIGATGAVSNSVGYYQQVNRSFNDFDESMDFALLNNISNEEWYEDRVKLIGFAMLIKRQVLDRIGLLDERFTPGNFEDDDLSFRILKSGYRLILCKDSYIHHFGSVSFGKSPNDYSELMKNNSKKFNEKWGFHSEYSTFIRNEIISLIQENKDAKINILEVGCACGATLLKIKDIYHNSKIYGIELDENSASISKCFADVRAENIENSTLGYEEGFFDYIIFADVLEHVYDPELVLKNIKKYLKKDGYLLISLPNVMHYSVIRSLLSGNWTYEDSGILDKTHVRFFTLNEIVKLFDRAGYATENILSNGAYMDDEGRNFLDSIGKIENVADRAQFEAYQYIFRAFPKEEETIEEIINSTIESCSKGDFKIIQENISKIQKVSNGFNLDELSKKVEIEKARYNKIKFLLRRIDFNLDIQSTKEVVDEVNKDNISIESFIEIIKRTTINKEAVFNNIAISFYSHKKYEHALSLLQAAYMINDENEETLYNLSFILNLFGEKEMALKYINKIKEKNYDILMLIKDIEGV